MSVSRIPKDDPNNLGMVRQLGTYPIANRGSSNSSVPSPISLYPKDISIENKQFSHSVGLFAGLAIFTLAMVIVVVALTCLAPGIPQSIILAIALSGVSLGGISAMKNIVYKIRDVFSPHMSEKQRIKSAMGVGIGFSALGFAMKVGGIFVPGGYDAVVGRLGGSASSGGTSSLFTSLSHYIYVKHFRSQKAASGEPLTRIEIMQEARKLHYISLSLLSLGTGFAILGIVLGIVGSLVVGGVPAAVLLVLSPPLISIGIEFVLRTLLHSSVAKWKNFLESRRKQELFVDFGLKDIRNEVLLGEDLEESISINNLHEEGTPQYANIQGKGGAGISSEEINRRLSLTTRQKILFSLSVLLLIAGIAAIFASGFAGMTVIQVLLVSTIGSTVAFSVLPMVSSGFAHSVFQMKARFKIAQARRKEKLEKQRFLRQLPKDVEKLCTEEEINHLWATFGSDVIVNTEVSIKRELDAFDKGISTQGSIFAGIFLVCGIGIMLFALIPALSPIVAGILKIGSTFLVISGGLYLKQLSSWMFLQLVKLRYRLNLRREQLHHFTSKNDISDESFIPIDPVFDDLNPGDFDASDNSSE